MYSYNLPECNLILPLLFALLFSTFLHSCLRKATKMMKMPSFLLLVLEVLEVLEAT